MRPRHLLILLVLAAIPVGLAILLAGGGGSRHPATAQPAQLSLRLVGGLRKQTLAACGSAHHYTVFRNSAKIRFRGSVTVAGSWSVAIKLKACEGGVFQPAGSAPATHRAGATYHGDVAAPIAGFYFARAELRQRGATIARSDKRYFEILNR